MRWLCSRRALRIPRYPKRSKGPVWPPTRHLIGAPPFPLLLVRFSNRTAGRARERGQCYRRRVAEPWAGRINCDHLFGISFPSPRRARGLKQAQLYRAKRCSHKPCIKRVGYRTRVATVSCDAGPRLYFPLPFIILVNPV